MSIIDEELAKAFLDDPDNVDISKATEITDGAAEVLSKHEGYLGLTGLTQLSDAAAESLSKHEGNLSLSGLTKLSDAAAESLSKHEGAVLWLNGLTELSDAAAESLAKHKGRLDLSSLTELTNTSLASKLAGQEGNLYLNSLTELSDATAESLSKHQGHINFQDPKKWVASLHTAGAINGGKEQVQGDALKPKRENNSIFIRKRENYTAYLASEPLEVNVGLLRKCDPPYKGDNHEKLLDYLNEHCFASGSGGDWFARNQEVYGDDIHSLSLEDVELKEFGGSYEKYQDTWHEVGRSTGEVGNKHGDFELIASNIS